MSVLVQENPIGGYTSSPSRSRSAINLLATDHVRSSIPIIFALCLTYLWDKVNAFPSEVGASPISNHDHDHDQENTTKGRAGKARGFSSELGSMVLGSCGIVEGLVSYLDFILFVGCV